MENQKIRVELSRLCRTCCAECSHMSPLFARDSDVSRGLDDMLMTCTNLKILETDGSPNSICDQCVDQLKSAYRFQQRCETADRYYKRLRLKSNSDCVQIPMVFSKDPNYDYIEMLKNNLNVFRCRECCQAFSTISELKNHKQIHLKNETTEEKYESLSVTQPVDFTEEENKEEHLLEVNQEEDIDEGGDGDSNSSFFKKFDNRDTEENSEMDAMPMESEIKEEELLTFTDTIIKEEIEDNGKGEYNVSNICFQQSYQKDTKKLEVVAIQKKIKRESLLEVLKEANARPENNVKRSSSDNRDEDYSPSSDSNSDYFPDQTHRINIGTKNQKHLNTCRQHRLVKKLNSQKTDCPRMFQCTDCGQKFDDHKVLQDHCKTNPNKRFKCNVCDQMYASNSALNRHKLTHNPNKPFKCDVCEKSFARNSTFRQHKRTHNPNKPFKCDICEKSFTCSKYLREHKFTHDPNKRFKCDVCEKSFPCSSNFSRHKLTHNTCTPLKCDMCEKSFSCSRNLQAHKWTHNPNKRFKCDMCEKSYSCSSNFRKHKLTHNARTPLKCDMCEKSFSCSMNLQQHKWTHNPNKRFKCNVCEKLFTHSSSLRRHQLTHNKPIKSDVLREIIHIQQHPQEAQVDTQEINTCCNFAGHSDIRHVMMEESK